MAHERGVTQRTIVVGLCAVMVAAGLSIGLLAPSACQESRVIDLNHTRVVMGGEKFKLEVAADDPTRIKGLAGRESIADHGGMLFVFPNAAIRHFVMRDCLTDIDIAFLDDAGRVVAMHTMEMEPRLEGESDFEYESRLKKYSSRFPARFAAEFAAGTLTELNVSEGDVLNMDVEALKQKAR